ncbi:MAG: TerB family tellurite resistance protein [Lentisphaeria bacterium]|nr:TerB family tellurite resistance protein [Lentisphaeria bacterium]
MKAPSDVLNHFNADSELEAHPVQLRSIADINGELGESWLLANKQYLYIYSKKMGDDFRHHKFVLNEISKMDVYEERPFAILELTVDTNTYRLKFASYVYEDLNTFTELRDGSEPAAPVEKVEESIEFNHKVAFCSALYAMVQADGIIENEELNYLNHLFEPPDIIKGIEYLQRMGAIKVVEEISENFSKEQSLCLMANLMEVAMVDNLIRSSEKKMMKKYSKSLGLKSEDFEAIFEILMIKNNTAVFD